MNDDVPDVLGPLMAMRRAMLRYARRRLVGYPQDAEDLVQEAYGVTWARHTHKQFTDAHHACAYGMLTLKGLVMAWYRHRAAMQAAQRYHHPVRGESVEAEIPRTAPGKWLHHAASLSMRRSDLFPRSMARPAHWMDEQMWRWYQGLGERQRDAVLLMCVHGEQLEDACIQVGIRPETLMPLQARSPRGTSILDEVFPLLLDGLRQGKTLTALAREHGVSNAYLSTYLKQHQVSWRTWR